MSEYFWLSSFIIKEFLFCARLVPSFLKKISHQKQLPSKNCYLQNKLLCACFPENYNLTSSSQKGQPLSILIIITSYQNFIHINALIIIITILIVTFSGSQAKFYVNFSIKKREKENSSLNLLNQLKSNHQAEFQLILAETLNVTFCLNSRFELCILLNYI